MRYAPTGIAAPVSRHRPRPPSPSARTPPTPNIAIVAVDMPVFFSTHSPVTGSVSMFREPQLEPGIAMSSEGDALVIFDPEVGAIPNPNAHNRRIYPAIKDRKAFAFDVSAACAGSIYAMSIADQFIRCGTVKRALVIGAETFSRILDWNDRTTCVLFGDGAGAVVLEAQQQAGEREDRRAAAGHVAPSAAAPDQSPQCR